MDVCSPDLDFVGTLGTLLRYSFFLLLLFFVAASLVVPDNRLPGVSKKEAIKLHKSSMLQSEKALEAFNKTGRRMIRAENLGVIYFIVLLVLFLVTHQICFDA